MHLDGVHDGEYLTRRFNTRFLICLNPAHVYWSSKKQGSCETSAFGSESMKMKQCCGYLRRLRCKLMIMNIPVDFPSFVFSDNQIVL